MNQRVRAIERPPMPDRAERPDLLPDGYRVTLECGHSYTIWVKVSWSPNDYEACPDCGGLRPVLDVIPAYSVTSYGQTTWSIAEPPALRSRWVRLLSRWPRLQSVVDHLLGPWRA